MKFQYTQRPDLQAGMPFVPLILSYGGSQVSVSALVDSGSMVSVLPYDVGLELGLVWEEQTLSVPSVGNLAATPAYGVLVRGRIADFSPVALVFGWTRETRQDVPVILGQLNFFQHFRVCFEAYNTAFDISPRP